MTKTDDSLIKYPCDFPIKVMGASHPDFKATVISLVQGLVADFDPATITSKPSSTGKYIGLSITVRVHSREQLDNIYRALSSHDMVAVVL